MTRDVPGAREKAALTIQRVWRSRRGHGKALGLEDRWNDAAIHAKLQTVRDPADEGDNDRAKRWRRGAFLVSRLRAGGIASIHIGATSKDGPRPKDEKILETQHRLELTDTKHRYGSNLKYYHRRWKQEDTEENFFKWLDRGGGKDISLPECSREQLEKERILYAGRVPVSSSLPLTPTCLSDTFPRAALNYKVRLDQKGLLRWVRNNELMDTTAGRWQDSGDGSGIRSFDVATDDPPPIVHRTSFGASLLQSGISPIVSAGSQDNQDATHYVETSRKRNLFRRWIRRHLTVKGWTELLLRKAVRRNTWIYVAGRQFDLHIGIKDTGTFRYSLFLGGGLVTSAGLISVHGGLVHKLSPLSGHYRTKIDSFRHFVEELEERHVDLHRAKISRAELALWGIERVKFFEQKESDVGSRAKQKAKAVASELAPKVNEKALQWRRDVLLGRKRSADPRGDMIGDAHTMAPGHSKARMVDGDQVDNSPNSTKEDNG